MLKKCVSLVAAMMMASSLIGCGASASETAEKHLDSEVAKTYPSGTVYLSSRDGFTGSATFTPDGVSRQLAVVTSCFADRDATVEVTVTQDSVLVGGGEVSCSSEGLGTITLTSSGLDLNGGDMTVDMSEEDAQDMALRIVGFNE